MPGNESWIPSGIIWGMAFIWLVLTTVYYFRHWHDNRGSDVNHAQQYVNRVIVDSKVPAVLEITDTLQKMADYQNMILNKLMNKEIKANKLANMQKAIQRRLDIKPRDPHLGNTAKIELIKKQMKKLGLYTKDFREEHVQFMVEISWVLNDFNVGIFQYLDNEEYEELKALLNIQTAKIARDKAEEMILIYQDLVLGLNSMIAYIKYFPQKERDKMPYEMQKSIKQLKYERDQMLKNFLQKISKEIERELHGNSKQ